MKHFTFPGVRGEPIHQKPGIWPDVPFDTYLSWNAISNSSLSAAVFDINPLVISMSHYRCQKPMDDSPTLRFGRYAHAGRFEFLTALKDFVVMPEMLKHDVDKEGNVFESQCLDANGKPTDSRNAKMYKDRVARFKTFHIGKTFVEQPELERQQSFLYALDSDELSRRYFANRGPQTDYELSIVWKDKDTLLLCKARIDCAQHAPMELLLEPGFTHRALPDLKSTVRLSVFDNTIANCAYHRQGAFYQDGMKTITGYDYWPCLVPAEANVPHTVGAGPLERSTILAGRHQYKSILAAIAKSIETDNWPGPKLPGTWEVPAWAMPESLAI